MQAIIPDIVDVDLRIEYDANGGNGEEYDTVVSKQAQEYPVEVTATLRYTDAFSRYGYYASGWSTNKNASNPSYSSHGSYTYTFNSPETSHKTTMYVIWKRRTYTVSYKPGSNGTGSATSDTKTFGTALTLKGAIFTRSGYTQVGWATSDGGAKVYDLNASYTTNAAITLYPVWEQSHNVYVKVNGVWKKATALYVKVGGQWENITNAYVKVGGTWKSS